MKPIALTTEEAEKAELCLIKVDAENLVSGPSMPRAKLFHSVIIHF